MGDGTIEELFLTALTALSYQDAIYAWPRPVFERFDELVRHNTRQDPAWTAGFLRWLRAETPMRYPALVGAAAFVSERLAHDQHGMSRQLVDSVLQRADDPGHLLAHWVAGHGPSVPKPVKRGIADAVTRLYDEQALRYDTGGHHVSTPRFVGGPVRTPRPFRFGDVVALVHPVAHSQEQGDFFRHVRRRVPANQPPAPMSLADMVAGLRKFDEAGMPFEEAMNVAARLTDPAEVHASGLLPLRFAAAWQAVLTRRWQPALATAAGHSLARIPRIPGRTLIVIGPGTVDGVVFGLSLAQRCDHPEVVSPGGRPFEVIPGESPLHGLVRWQSTGLAHDAMSSRAFAGHGRVVLVADRITDLPEADAPLYAWQTVHDEHAEHRVEPSRVVFHGLTDAAFGVIPLVEGARSGRWPW
jgi:hypothetical protein